MKKPKLHFDSELPHQKAAVDAVCDLFHGQESGHSLFTVSGNNADLFTPAAGVGNRLRILPEQLRANLNEVQERNGLPLSSPADLRDERDLNFTVEMETGTGKTYVYLRTVYELNRRFGFTKFIVVVPSVAIREGVHKSLQITEDHFKAIYDGTPLRYFTYDSAQLGQVRNFAYSSGIELMIVTAAAINKQATAKIYQRSEQTGGEAPIELIRQVRPILIVDEPQSVDGGPQGRGRQALRAMDPLFSLRYSATHVDVFNMVYKLDAVDAYQAGLVKQIEVAGGAVEHAHGRPFVRLEKVSTRKNDHTATVVVDAMKSGHVVRETRKVGSGDSLEEITNNRVYEGLLVGDVTKGRGKGDPGYIQIYGGGIDEYLKEGEAYGDIPVLERARHLINKTIRVHLERELELRSRGIKVLSLFFIDRVDRYRAEDPDGNPVPGEYAKIFENEYAKLRRHPQYSVLFDGADLDAEPGAVHQGYFARDAKGKPKDIKEGAAQDGADAERAYDLIMREKERLLSLEEPVKFIFSHSALREGWDNPNVFQICSLREMGTERQRRQTIGRGLRLAVNQEGQRLHGFDVNTLTVVATESLEQFAASLQTEYEQDAKVSFGRIEPHQFSGLLLPGGHGNRLGSESSQRLFAALQESGYIQGNGKIDAQRLQQALAENAFTLPEEFSGLEAAVAEQLQQRAKGVTINDRDERRTVKVRKQVFESPQFRELWDRIKHKTTYRVDFDPEKLIANAAKALKEELRIQPARMLWTTTTLAINERGVETGARSTSAPQLIDQGEVPLPDILSELAEQTRLTRRTIHRILSESGRFKEFHRNPQEFMALAAEKIMEERRAALVDGIKYVKLGEDDVYAQELFLTEELHGYLHRNLTPAAKSVYEEVRYDSEVERKFVEELESADDVEVYAKLPAWFKVPTPFGSYNPDWAIVRRLPDGERRLYLVIETKGTQQEGSLRPEERGKIKCGRRHFAALGTDVTFEQADAWRHVTSLF
ncbi:type III restriction-modification system endonuclease [Kitasatospora phosalacinea]|uniref:type III restriction-modification system endonuclease n=1 Tax=Kitasatospora phosalacinea TaxID=2065 RepID=UPI0036580460